MNNILRRQMTKAGCSEEFIDYVSIILNDKEIDNTCSVYVSEHEVEFTTDDGFNINIKD